MLSVEFVCKLYVKFELVLFLLMCFGGDDEHNDTFHDKLMLMCKWCWFGVLCVQYIMFDVFLFNLGGCGLKSKLWKCFNEGNRGFFNLHSGDESHRRDRHHWRGRSTIMHLGELTGINVRMGRLSWSPRRISCPGVIMWRVVRERERVCVKGCGDYRRSGDRLTVILGVD